MKTRRYNTFPCPPSMTKFKYMLPFPVIKHFFTIIEIVLNLAVGFYSMSTNELGYYILGSHFFIGMSGESRFK